MNRLSQEISPYLLKHADDPVHWYPWGQQAFKAAADLDRPIFLSIGYGTCHWCHVMQKESFKNPEIARLLNEWCINIKVDREEHPEVDNLYMELAQPLLDRPGGWPLNLFLTPDQKPFFATTYLPPQGKKDLLSFPELLTYIHQVWVSEEKQLLIQEATKLVELFATTSNATGHDLPGDDLLAGMGEKLLKMADPLNGGLKGAPKFPLSYQLEFFLWESHRQSDGRHLFYVELTLDKMLLGGIYDQLGGGFYRYAADEAWKVPHFEKMLYTQATLAKTYTESWKLTKKESYRQAARSIIDYVLTELTSPLGGFFTGEDADSEGVEGLYYTWTPLEIQEVLPGEQGELVAAFFDVTHQGNFEGRNILSREVEEEEFAESMNLDGKAFKTALEQGKNSLLKKRQTRAAPFKDLKILTSWNGLMIEALVSAGVAFSEKKYLDAAVYCAEFIQKNLGKEGLLFHVFLEKANISAFLTDFVFLIRALLSLFEAGCGGEFLEWAISLAKVVERDFKEIEGAFYETDGKEDLILRRSDFYDGQEPSGNGVHAENLLRLYQLTGEEGYLNQAEDILKASKHYLEQFTAAACYQGLVLQRYLNRQAPTIVVALNEKKSNKQEIISLLSAGYHPHLSVFWKEMGQLPWHADKHPLEGETTLYICRWGKCQAPIKGLSEITTALEKLCSN